MSFNYDTPFTDTIFIGLPEDISTGLILPAIGSYEEVEYLVTYDYLSHAIVMFDLTNKLFVEKVLLSKEGPDFVKTVRALGLMSKDRVIVAGDSYISVIDMSFGRIIQRFNFSSIRNKSVESSFAGRRLKVNQYSGLQYDGLRNSVLLAVDTSVLNRQLQYAGARIAEYFFNSDRIHLLNVFAPDNYSSLKGDYGDLATIGFTRVGNHSIAFNFPLSSELFFIEGSEHGAVARELADPVEMAQPIVDFTGRYSTSRMKHSLKSLCYYPPVFDRYANLYYRIHNKQIEDIETKPDIYLTIYNSGFKKLSEIRFPVGYYIFPIVSRQGLMFSAFNKHDDKLELIRYRMR